MSCIKSGAPEKAGAILKEGLMRVTSRDEASKIRELLQTLTEMNGL